MAWTRLRKAVLVLLTGGMLLQTTAGCEQLVAPLIANVVSSMVMNALLGGLTAT